MSEARYRLHLAIRGATITREIMLDSEEPAVDVLNWVDDEYEFRATLKKVYLLRENGRAEQIYQR